MGRSAKYYELINTINNMVSAYLCWNYQFDPDFHILVFASTQVVFVIWLYLARPFKSTLVNTFLLLSETFMMIFLVGGLLKSKKLIEVPSLENFDLNLSLSLG